MQCKSASSVNTDAYRAGAEIGRSLREIAPEVIIFFSSITYDEDFTIFFEGLFDELGSSGPIIFGGTGDGIYETDCTADYGVSALGINSGGAVTWTVAVESGTKEDSFRAARHCALRISTSAPGFAFVLADGVTSDGTRIVEGVESVLRIPFWGGLTGDDRNFTRSRLFVNGQVVKNSVAILAADASIRYAVHAASGWTPTGETGLVDEVDGQSVCRISGQSAQSFMKEQLGKPFGETDLGTVALATYRSSGARHFFLRAPSRFDPDSGAISTFGSIAVNSPIRICTATAADIINSTRELLQAISPGFIPSAAIVISCAGRKWLVPDCARQELQLIFDTLGRKIPLIGLASFGEISPFRKSDGTYSPSFFHNATLTICLLGGRP